MYNTKVRLRQQGIKMASKSCDGRNHRINKIVSKLVNVEKSVIWHEHLGSF